MKLGAGSQYKPRRTWRETRDAADPRGIRLTAELWAVRVHTARATNRTTPGLPAPYDWANEDINAA